MMAADGVAIHYISTYIYTLLLYSTHTHISNFNVIDRDLFLSDFCTELHECFEKPGKMKIRP